MDVDESRVFDSYMGGSTNPGPHYPGQPQTGANQPPPGVGPEGPAPGQRVRHAKSGETGTVTGTHVHGHTGERYPTVRWDGQQGVAGAAPDQGYSLDSLTTP